MAVKKSTTKAEKLSIPAADRKAVTQYKGFMIAAGEKNVTDQKAYQLHLRIQKKDFEELTKKLAAEAKERKREARERATELIDPAIMKLGDVRDLLKTIEHGGSEGTSDSALAMFARTALIEAGTELEQALFDLGFLKKGEHDYRPGGWFVEEIEGEAHAEVQKTSQVTA